MTTDELGTVADAEEDGDDTSDEEAEGVAALPAEVQSVIDRFRGKKGDLEDETIITRTKDSVIVWSSIGTDIVRILTKVGRVAKITLSGNSVRISVPPKLYRAQGGFRNADRKKRVLTEAQREAARVRLQGARQAKSEGAT